jgi:RNA polymerase sigma-70 factor, ECF subfamily
VGRLEDRATLKTWIYRDPGEQGPRTADSERAVITLRDVESYNTEEVCSVLDISPGKQRVLLHRARAAVRAPLEDYFAAGPSVG